MPASQPRPAPGSGPKQIRLFLLALGFLTRLGPALPASREELAQSSRYYPLVGALLGLVLALPLYLGLFSGHPQAGGWFYAAFSAFLTRGLHHDGLADLADALGSGKEGDEFWAVVKDSRLGAFGCLALVLAVGGQALFTAGILASDAGAPRLALLVLAPVLGRCLPAVFAWRVPPRAASVSAGLGGILSQPSDSSPPAVALTVGLLGPLLCLSFIRAALCWVFCLAVLWWLARVARRHGGFNGDFLGAAIVLGETAALLAALV